MTALRTIRAVVEIQVRGICTEDDLRKETARLVIGKMNLPRNAQISAAGPLIKSYSKLAAAERRSQPAHQKILETQAQLVEAQNMIAELTRRIEQLERRTKWTEAA